MDTTRVHIVWAALLAIGLTLGCTASEDNGAGGAGGSGGEAGVGGAGGGAGGTAGEGGAGAAGGVLIYEYSE